MFGVGMEKHLIIAVGAGADACLHALVEVATTAMPHKCATIMYEN